MISVTAPVWLWTGQGGSWHFITVPEEQADEFRAECLARRGGFGSVINAGKLDDILAYIDDNDLPFYSGIGRFYIVKYNGKPEGDVDYATEGVTAEGIMPLYQRCVHLGCRVPFCQQSQWFECPCHGSKYNRVGEKQGGPAPRGLDRFPLEVSGGSVVVDTGVIVIGPPIGTNTTNQSPEGAPCV